MVETEHGSPARNGGTMPVSHTIPVAAPVRTVAAALAEPWLLRQALADVGLGAVLPRSDQLCVGDELVVRVFRVPYRLRVTRADERGLCLTGVGNRVRVRATTEPTATGTLLTCGVAGAPRGLPPGSRVSRLVRRLLVAVRDRAPQLADAPVVVGAVIQAGDTVLAAQRDRPPAAAGRWEFPGGKVERAEDERAALVRECAEELAADVLVDDRIGPDLVLANGWVLRLYTARLAPGARPVAGEHRALRWVPADRLADLDWLDPDRVALPALARQWREAPSTDVDD